MSMGKDLSSKRLLVLGGSIQCLKVVTEARKLGIYTIVTDISAVQSVCEAADEVLPYSVMDVDGLYKWCKDNPVDGILNYCIDYSQHAHQKLCEKLGLPCYGTEEQYHILTDKTAFKNLCKQCGVDVIPEYDENNTEEIDYPVLVKPAESSGSRGLAICYNADELYKAVEEARSASRNGKLIIEKYMGGKPDFTVTILMIEGIPYLIRVGDRHLGKAEDGLDRQCICTTSPSVYTSLYLEKAHDNLIGMLKYMGIQTGPVFFQGFIDGEIIRFYDPGIRFPGGEYDRLFYAATGINVVEAMIRFALTGEIAISTPLENKYLLNGKTAVQLTVTACPGTIKDYGGFHDIEKIQGVVFVAPKSRIGAVIPATGDVKQRVVEIDYLADGEEEVRDISEKIYSKLRIKDELGRDMVVSKF